MTSRRFLPLATASLLLAAGAASANSSGIVGRSGKQEETCTGHHTGGLAPQVRLEGPPSVEPGALATFRFVVESQSPEEQILAGLNVAASAGDLGNVQGQGTQVEELRDGAAVTLELTHTRPRMNDAMGVAAWLFTWRAPDATGVETLFAAGNSVDGFGTMDGDRSAATQLEVLVGCAGDCKLDSRVTVDELITAVRLAQGKGRIDDCRLADGNGDGVVQLQELVTAVHRSLQDCR
jgi:hypothetical protein